MRTIWQFFTSDTLCTNECPHSWQVDQLVRVLPSYGGSDSGNVTVTDLDDIRWHFTDSNLLYQLDILQTPNHSNNPP